MVEYGIVEYKHKVFLCGHTPEGLQPRKWKVCITCNIHIHMYIHVYVILYIIYMFIMYENQYICMCIYVYLHIDMYIHM